MDLLIDAALESKPNKLQPLLTARVKIEKMKHFFRIINELDIIDIKKYISFEYSLQEVSKDTNNWISSLAPKRHTNANQNPQEIPLF